MIDKIKSRKRYLVPVGVILLGLLIMVALAASRRKPPKNYPVFPGVLVQVTEATVETRQITIRANGTVKPFREITLSPQVSGRVEWVSPNFAAGGHFKKG
ncbi:efflux RND transporter periplasmic adaptor subunit, partial [bacterium]|nr:efflux RND transporter periplasmic adaptor subunit [bacterium]